MFCPARADAAQLVEQRVRKPQVYQAIKASCRYVANY